MPKLTKERAQELLWDRGDLRFKLRDYQTVLYDKVSQNTSDVTVVNCARRFGKSFVLVLKALEKAIKCTNSNPIIIIASATAKELEDFIIPSFKIILDDCPDDIWPGWEEGYLRSKKKFVKFRNGAEIRLIGLDRNPDGGRGSYCDLYIIDEAAFTNNIKYIISSVASPMKRGRAGSKIILSSTPSPDPSHPFKELCERAQKAGNYIELTIMDNKSISEKEREIIRTVECLDESSWLREYMCRFVVDENLAITPEFDRESHVVSEMPEPDYFPYVHKYVAMDLGVKVDLTAILYAYFDPVTKKICIQAEQTINGPEMTTPVLVDMVVNKEQELWQGIQPYRRISDSDNPLLIQDLGYLHNLYFMVTNKDSLHAMVNEVRTFLKDDRIIIHKSCEKLIGCLEGGIWNKQRKAFGRSHLFGHYDHLAALVYLIRNLDQFSYPIPEYYQLEGKSTENRVFRKKDKQSTKNAKTLKKIFGV